jgi:molecular chaperone DnaK
MRLVGFDFGTSNSLVSSITSGKAINYLDSDGAPIPSVVCYEAGNIIVGREARKRVAEAGLGVSGNVVRSPKSLLGTDTVHVGGVSRDVVDVVADVIREVKRVATTSNNRKIDDVDMAVATIPVHFDGRKRSQLREAFGRAGIRVHQWIHEPFAALYSYFAAQQEPSDALRRLDRSLVLVFDWGGGTLDLTLCAIRSGTIHQIRNDGTDVCGGDFFDQAIMEMVVRAERDRLGFDAGVRVHPDARARLLDKCERAKVDLSNRDKALIYVNRFFDGVDDDAIELELSRTVLEKATEPLVTAGIGRIESLLRAAGVGTSQIAMCLATGGMIRMPAIQSRLNELFGPERVQFSPSGGLAIAEGAAWVAQHQSRLQLAKPIELIIARGSFLPLFPGGASMPHGGTLIEQDFDLYCVDPRDGHAKFQVVAPEHPSRIASAADPRRALATCTLQVHREAPPNMERLVLRTVIDQDLVLHGAARSLMQNSEGSFSVFDLEFSISTPWAQGMSASGGADPKPASADRPNRSPGELAVRSNVGDRPGDDLVPGELLYQTQPSYFDSRTNPPQQQVQERLYYAPCGRCGRMINDPLCTCGRQS